MDRVLVLQSFRPYGETSWYARCQQSVQAWAEQHSYDYAYCGDELFQHLPPWYLEKVGDRLPIAADLARLLWAQTCLSEGRADVVAWLDMDTYVLAPSGLKVNPISDSVFGYEHWLQKRARKAGHAVHKNVHNAYCAFRQDSPTLAFLIEAIQRMIARVDAEHMAPQFVGPKLLTSLHNIVGFELNPAAGAISPALQDALIEGDRSLVDRLQLSQPLLAANLCGSLHGEDDPKVHQLIDVLASFKSGLI